MNTVNKKNDYARTKERLQDFHAQHHQVLDALEQIGCDKHHLLDAEYSMMNCEKDTGLTYSSPEYRSSVAVVYKATSFKEFVNTLSHEVAHICAHITKAFVIKLTEEEFCYMLGDLMADVSDLIFDEAHR